MLVFISGIIIGFLIKESGFRQVMMGISAAVFTICYIVVAAYLFTRQF